MNHRQINLPNIRDYPKNRQSLLNLSNFLFSALLFEWLRDGQPAPMLFLYTFRFPNDDKSGFFGFSPYSSNPLESPGVLSKFTPISGKIGGSRSITTTPSFGVSVRSRTEL
jgi:hypothetical protein